MKETVKISGKEIEEVKIYVNRVEILLKNGKIIKIYPNNDGTLI
jgi:hypothetical protein